jgi:hypothetical protein
MNELKYKLYDALQLEIHMLQTLSQAVARGLDRVDTAPLSEMASALATERERLSRELQREEG